MSGEAHNIDCAVAGECSHTWVEIHFCVVCNRHLGRSRARLDTCSHACFTRLLSLQRRAG